MDSGIYSITNKANSKIYIGSTGSTMGFKFRWQLHKSELRGNRHANKHLQYSWNKYGEDVFRFDIIDECSDEILIGLEDYYIRLCNSMDCKFGYNKREAGSHGKHTEEAKEKCRISATGRKHTEETKEKCRIAGRKGKGIKRPSEFGLKVSLRNKCRITSIDVKDKISKSLMGHLTSEETKNKISIALKNYWIKNRII